MRDADRGHVEHRAEVHGQAGAARVVAPGGVDEQDVGGFVQGAHRGLEQRPLA